MTRGRKKDLTRPASRALAQQRDYRSRKAQYITDLEERCRRVEQDNVELRKQLELVRAGVPAAVGQCSAEITQLSSELLEHLGAASASLLRFQQLAANGICRPELWPQPNSTSTMGGHLRPASFTSPSTSVLTPTLAYQSYNRPCPQNEPTQRTNYSKSHETQQIDIRNNTNSPEVRQAHEDRSPSVDSECCGGFLDCQELVEEGDSGVIQTECVRTSEMRSTFESTSRNGI